MALEKNMMILILILMSVCEKSNGETYKVGDSAGWTSMGHVDYKTWATTKTFQVGDQISFEYNKQFHNVIQVTHKSFNSCNATAPFATMSSGNDTFVIRIPGHYYFICGFPGHCEAGQNVDIRVLERSSSSPSPSPISTPSEPTPYAPSSSWPFTPSPSPSGSSSGAHSSYKESLMSNFRWSILILVSVAFGIGR